MSKPWFRLYAEFASDAKMQLLAFEDQRHFIVVLCLKCNGTLDSNVPSAELRDKMIAKALGLEVSVAAEVRRRLMEIGVINADWQPIKWEDRQYDSDSSTQRTREWRERNRVSDNSKRHCDVTVTDESRSEQNRTESECATVSQAELAQPATAIAGARKRKAAESKASTTATRLPADFTLTPERKAVAVAERVDADRTFAKFSDYWRSASGAKSRKLDWDATWRNWCRSESDRGGAKQEERRWT